jgi:hypothetical protein
VVRGLSQINRIFAKDVLSYLGKRSIFDVARADLLDVLSKIERRNALTMLWKCRTWFNQLFRYAMVEVNLATNQQMSICPRPNRSKLMFYSPFLDRLADGGRMGKGTSRRQWHSTHNAI